MSLTVPSSGRREETATEAIDLRLLDWHEQVQPLRLASVMESVMEIGVHTPVRVTPRGGRFMILDGAHRARAAQALGHRELPCRVVPLPDRAAVDGWVHQVPGVVAPGERLSRSGAGRVVAILHAPDERYALRATHEGDGAYVEAMHALSRSYRHTSYERLTEISDGTEAPVEWREGTQVQWCMPDWGTICDLVEDYGLLPAGVTRLGRYLADT